MPPAFTPSTDLRRWKPKLTVTRQFGLVLANEPCSACDGKGHLKSKVTVAYEIFREIRRDAPSFPEPVLVVNCHPEVARVIQGEDRDELRYLMDRYNKTIQVKAQTGYHQEQFDIYGRQDRAAEKRAALALQVNPALDLHLIDRCGHLVMWDAPDAFAALAGDFLGGQRP